jgi:hypothetical protein
MLVIMLRILAATVPLAILCSCHSPGRLSDKSLAVGSKSQRTVTPVILGVGAIVLLDQQGPALIETIDSYLDHGAPMTPLTIEGPLADTSSDIEVKRAKFSAAAQLFQALGLSAEVKAARYNLAKVDATFVRQREIHWGNLARAIKDGFIRADVVQHLRLTNTTVVTSDIIVHGLVVEIDKNALSSASLEILQKLAETKAGVVTENSLGSSFTLRSSDDVLINTVSIEGVKVLERLNVPDDSVLRGREVEKKMALLKKQLDDCKAERASQITDSALVEQNENLKNQNTILQSKIQKMETILGKPIILDWNKRGGRKVAEAEKIRLKAILNEINPGDPDTLSRNNALIDRAFDFDAD